MVRYSNTVRKCEVSSKRCPVSAFRDLVIISEFPDNLSEINYTTGPYIKYICTTGRLNCASAKFHP